MKVLKKCVVALLICVMLVMDRIPTNAGAIIYISSESELRQIADKPKGNYVLTNDIVLSDGQWQHLGFFSGTLDGAGYTISNLNSVDYGLFWGLEEGAVVQNLTISGTINGEPSSTGLLADSSAGTILNCTSKGSIQLWNAATGGGLVGFNYGHMENCTNEADITNGEGGVAGNNIGSMVNCVNKGDIVSDSMHPGGVAGINNRLMVGCENYGSITTTLANEGWGLAAGGITGSNCGLIYQCINSGTVEQPVIRGAAIGGITGNMTHYAQVIECENTGELSGIGDVAGICGEASLDLGHFDENGVFVTHPGEQIIANCKNSGALTAISKNYYSACGAGIVADITVVGGKVQILNCENIGNITGTGIDLGADCGGAVGTVRMSENGALKLQGLYNSGAITAEESSASGIIHYMQNDTEADIEMSFCQNTGNIVAKDANGIGSLSNHCLVEYCSNLGNVTGVYNANGITALTRTGMKIFNCYNLGILTGQWVVGLSNGGVESPLMRNCYVYGELQGTNSEYISEQSGNLIMENCYYMQQEFLNDQEMGTALSAEDMEKQSSYVGFDFDNVWEMREQNGKMLPALKITPEKEPAKLQTNELAIRKGEFFTAPATEGTVIEVYSDNETVLSDDKDGNLEAVELGKCTVYCVFSDGQVIPCTVYVSNTGNIPIEPSEEIIAFVERMYTVVLGREAEKDGLEFWSAALANYEIDGAGLSGKFVLGWEFIAKDLSDDAFLDVMYQTFFGRTGDESGKSYWMSALSQGTERPAVLASFVNSEEFSAICDRYKIARGTMQPDGRVEYNKGVRDFVLRMYEKVLERDGETMGVEYWTNEILQDRATPEFVAKEYFHCEEYLNKNTTNAQYVETLYQAFMDRTSEGDGKEYWVGLLESGVSRDTVLEGFAYSEEFKNIMAQYGL